MKIARLIFIFFTSFVLLCACGGSAESLNRDDTNPNKPPVAGGSAAPTTTISMSILDAQGNQQTQLVAGSALNVNTRVLDPSGNPVQGQVVTYVLSQSELAVFSNDTATGLTNSEGVATIKMTVGALSGSGSVTASIDSSISVTAGFSSLGAPQSSPQNLTLNISIVDSQGNAQTQLADGAPLNANVRVLDASGNPVAGLLVSYVLSQIELATFSNDTATGLTNAAGIASIKMTVGTLSGSGTLTVNVDNIAPATIGFTSLDTIETVTKSLTLEVSLVDMQGNSQTSLLDGAPININARVLDSLSNPVPGLLVTYVLSQSNLADFNNNTSTGLTNSDGIATIQMSVGTLSGSGTVTVNVDGLAPVVSGFTSLGEIKAKPSSLELYANAIQLASSGGDQIELIAVMKNEQNILLTDIEVSFSVDENASLSDIDSKTGADGTARATLSTKNNRKNRVLNIVATSGALSKTLNINVVGTEVNINGSASVIINDTAPITIVLSDSDGAGIANQTVNLSASLGTLDNASPVTGANGQVTVNFISNAAGNSTITANALNASSSFELIVQQDDFSFDATPTDSLLVGENHALSLRWFKNNLPFANGDVTITSSRGLLGPDPLNNSLGSTTTTDVNGIAGIMINSKYAGPSLVSAIGTDGNGNTVTARASIDFFASEVDSIYVDATPDVISPEGQTATIIATLRDEIGNLIKGKPVSFKLDIDASGGSISPISAITDSNGIASTVYTSNAVSGDRGVTVSAQSDGVIGKTELSVGDRAFDISLGTGSIIQTLDNSTYLKEFAVFVTDASGRPIANAELNGTITPPSSASGEFAYYKGRWEWNAIDSIYEVQRSISPQPQRPTGCLSEDLDKDGILDFNDNNPKITEDRNGDGFLTPGNVATVTFKENISRTNEFGQATLQILYPKEFGIWTRVVLTVYGQSAGSESKQSQLFTLGVAASDLIIQAIQPPNSPFGTSGDCTSTD